MNKYQLIKNHDRVVSVADDANENMMAVSRIEKSGRIKMEVVAVRWLMPLGLHGYNLQSEKDIEIMSKYRPIEKHDTTVGAWQTMQTRI